MCVLNGYVWEINHTWDTTQVTICNYIYLHSRRRNGITSFIGRNIRCLRRDTASETLDIIRGQYNLFGVANRISRGRREWVIFLFFSLFSLCRPDTKRPATRGDRLPHAAIRATRTTDTTDVENCCTVSFFWNGRNSWCWWIDGYISTVKRICLFYVLCIMCEIPEGGLFNMFWSIFLAAVNNFWRADV